MSRHSDSPWTHPICGACYQLQEPGRIPSVMAEEYRDLEICCWCDKSTDEGIYYRSDPSVLACQ